jgi:hypothetical protein
MILSASVLVTRCICGNKRDKFTTEELAYQAELEKAGIPVFPKTLTFFYS